MPAAAWLLGLRVRILLRAWMFLSCCFLCGSGLCDEPITRSEESYRMCVPNFLWYRSLKRKRAVPELVCSATEKSRLWTGRNVEERGRAVIYRYHGSSNSEILTKVKKGQFVIAGPIFEQFLLLTPPPPPLQKKIWKFKSQWAMRGRLSNINTQFLPHR